jgi:hypothetical protein
MAPSDVKKVELTTIKQNSGKPITSFLDYSPRTVDPPRIDDNGIFNARVYAAYLNAYDTYLVKFFQVRRQFLTLLREGVPTESLVRDMEEVQLGYPGSGVHPSHAESLFQKGVAQDTLLVVGNLVVPQVPVVNAPTPPPPSDDLKKERKIQARKRRAARRRAQREQEKPKQIGRKIETLKAQTTLAKVEAGWTKVISRQEKRRLAKAAGTSSTGDPAGKSKASATLRRSTAVRRKSSPKLSSGETSKQ